MRAVVWVLSLLLLLVGPFGAAAAPYENSTIKQPSPEVVPEAHLETVAPVDVQAVAQEYESLGTMTLVVAGIERVLVLHEHDIFAPGGRAVTTINPDGSLVVVGEVTARAFQGHVKDKAHSSAFITLDVPENALMGVAYVNDRAYSIRTEEAVNATLLKSSWVELHRRPLPLSHHIHDGHGDLGTFSATFSTTIRVVGDDYYAGDGWTTLVTDAFNQQHAMWDNDVLIHQQIRFSTMPHYPTYDSGELTSHFRAYVAAGIRDGYWFEDAYQLIAANDMAVPEDVLGVGTQETGYDPKLDFGTSDMVSIVEGWDHDSFDSYDPYNSYHLGIVSATELGHGYGEWDHPQDCRTSLGACVGWNVMASGIALWYREFWFTSESINRITYDSWHQL